MISFLLEVIFEVFAYIAYQLVYSKRIPLVFRILIALVLIIFFGGVFIGLMAVGIFMILDGYPLGWFMFILGLVLMVLAARMGILDFKMRNKAV